MEKINELNNYNIYCAGVIIFFKDSTVLVQTKNGNYSFPKGGREKGENIYQTALRELNEETGIEEQDIDFYTNSDNSLTYIDEYKTCATIKPSIRYYLAELKEKKHLEFKDPDELDQVSYVKMVTALEFGNELKDKRKDILRAAMDFRPKKANVNTHLSKALSWILRHGIIKERLDMNSAGYVKMDDILQKSQFREYNVEDIISVVKSNDKQRFKLMEINEELYIRAEQGHCATVGDLLNDDDMMTRIMEPFPICVHGTTKKAIKIISKEGLIAMSRKHIHFAIGTGEDENVISGLRLSSRVLIFINMELALQDGKRFYLSDNGVILTKDNIEPKYFLNIEYV
jgi:2'-phosphotransferase